MHSLTSPGSQDDFTARVDMATPDVHPKILLVDDDDSGRLLSKLALEGTGYQVIEAPTAEIGLERCMESKPDAAVIDAVLPGMDGFDMCRTLREMPAFRELPIMILTGLEDPACKRRAYDAGANDLLFKSPEWQTFTDRVRELLSNV